MYESLDNCTFVNLCAIVSNQNCSRVSSVGGALDCRVGGRRFDSCDWTNTRGLEITEK